MRLITRGDLDGLACATIIKANEDIDEVLLIHPQQITDGEIEVTGEDILANVPYHEACARWFDHHLLTNTNKTPPKDFDGKFGYAPSAAELVWKYYGSEERFSKLVEETSRLDSARLTRSDVLDPKDFILLGFTLDSRSSLGHYEEYFHQLLGWLHNGMEIEEILAQDSVVERCSTLREQDAEFRRLSEECSQLVGNVIVTDFREVPFVPPGNRFLIFLIYPKGNVSMRIMWGPDRKFPVVACGHSIFKRTCSTNIGVLMSKYGGGGHMGAGSTPIRGEDPEATIAEILSDLTESAPALV